MNCSIQRGGGSKVERATPSLDEGDEVEEGLIFEFLLRQPPAPAHGVGEYWQRWTSGYLCGSDALVTELCAVDLDAYIPARTMHSLVYFVASDGPSLLNDGRGTRRFDPAPGRLVLLPSREILHIRHPGPLHTWRVDLAPHLLRRPRDRGLIQPTLRLDFEDGVLTRLLDALRVAAGEGREIGRDLAEGVVKAVCARLADALSGEEGGDGSPLSQAALQVLHRYIDEAANAVCTSDQAAARLGLSRERFERQLRTSTGLTFHRFVLDYRLRRARLLMKQEGCSLTDLAYELGFADLSHFSRSFKRRYGVPPSRLRFD